VARSAHETEPEREVGADAVIMSFPLRRPDREQTYLAAHRRDTLVEHVTQFERRNSNAPMGSKLLRRRAVQFPVTLWEVLR
jgi:hypothetical protein